MSHASSGKAFDYSERSFPVRADLVRAFRHTWASIAAAGTWLTGAQRTQIALEVRQARSCTLCAERKAALSPFAGVDREHDGTHGDLSPELIDVAHRTTTDASRLTRAWLDGMLARGLTVEAYVETLSVVVSTLAIDTFHDALGFDPEPLPPPEPGTPSQARPPAATLRGAWVPMVAIDEVSPEHADMYQGMGRTVNVVAAMSIVPEAVRLLRSQSAAMYLDVADVVNPATNGGRRLTRPQIELIAGRVSAMNDCFY